MAVYARARYWTTHNSYEGNQRDWIPGQLCRKIRCLELDVWDNGYERIGDFRLGHLKPGDSVAYGDGSAQQNPKTPLLREWLRVIASWSEANDHSVITLVLDLKSDLTDNATAGDLEDLNQTLEKAFGSMLFTREDYDGGGGWPETAALRNRIICVVSGDSNNRASYRYCFGEAPAIACNAAGRVVLAYRSGGRDMRYWSGKASLRSKRVDWERKGTYAWNKVTVSEPSLAMNDEGWVVSVHRIGPRPEEPGPALLECTVGQLQDDGRIFWFDPARIATGMLPSLELAGPNRLRLIYTTESGKGQRLREGLLNRARKRVDWKDSAPSTGPAFPRDVAIWKGHELRSVANPGHTIFCAFDGASVPVRYRQVAFVELQDEENRAAFVDPVFYGTSAARRAHIASARDSGLVARGWWFKEGDQTAPPSPSQENFAATDTPFDPWYGNYMSSGGQTEV